MLRKEKMPQPAAINKVSLNLFSATLDDFEKSLEKRRELALFFQDELKKLGFEVQESENFTPHRTRSGAGNVFCYLSALVPKELEQKRDKIVEDLRKYRVFCTRIWHTPIILDQEKYPNTFEAAKRIINFPLQNYYTKKDIKKMATSISKVLTKY